MKLLAIDTSSDACSVALMIDQEIIQDCQLSAQKHATVIMPMLDQLMSTAGVSIPALDGVVYGRGPGSFTGVRIGIALTQGIALGADIGVLGISTLQAIAQGCQREFGDQQVAACIDARMDEVYIGAFSANVHLHMQATGLESVCKPAELNAPGIAAGMVGFHWAGSGADRYAKQIAEIYAEPKLQVRHGRLPQARDMLTLAKPLAEQQQLQDPASAIPVYLRDKVAKTTQEQKASRMEAEQR